VSPKDQPENNSPSEEEEEKEMTFLEHLEELRWRIIWALLGLVIGTIICFIFIDFLVDVVLLRPARNSGAHLQNLKPFGQLFLYFQVAMIGGVILSLPNIFYQLWKFIAPALKKSERKYISAIVIFTSLCFLCGIVFAYFIMLPLTLKFAAQFGSSTITNQFAIDEYMNIIISVMLGAGLIFELPMISFFLTKLGILKPQFMKKYRRHAIVIIMVAAAFLTPGTDPVSQVILAVPLLLLYEISILISKLSVRKT
jgi:sec-independent protein translocase protein TatC